MSTEVDQLRGRMRYGFSHPNERRAMIPLCSAHRVLWNIILTEHPHDTCQQQTLMSKYSPLAEFLTRTQTINQFIHLKDYLYGLAAAENDFNLSIEVADRLSPYPDSIFLGPVDRQGWERDKTAWLSAINWTLKLGAALRIIPPEHIEDLKANNEKGFHHKKDPRRSDIDMWRCLETDSPHRHHFVRVHNRSTNVLSSLDLMVRGLEDNRNCGYSNRRLGMIIGDFRVGDHVAHREFFRNAKNVVGSLGDLLVITPSRKTILATTDKTKVWPDEERTSHLSVNPDIDHVWIADMPEEYYFHPELYWRQVWGRIKPDLVFLGEENHPLQPQYELQSRYLGGILLIDPQPVFQRSQDLIM